MKSQITVYSYPRCSTCRDAIAFLENKKIPFTLKDISQTPPKKPELLKMLGFQKGELKKLFNTSGLVYKDLQLKDKLPDLSRDEALELLAKHGMLVKRPFVLGDDFGLLGFKEANWEAALESLPHRGV